LIALFGIAGALVAASSSLILVLMFLMHYNPEAEQDETQQPLSAALFTCPSVVSTSTP
jgi:hypothetical protein